MSDPLVIGLVAGESSGDTLGAALLEALRARVGKIEAFGIAGPRMRAAGVEVAGPRVATMRVRRLRIMLGATRGEGVRMRAWALSVVHGGC